MRPRRGSSTWVRWADRARSSWTWPTTSSSRTCPAAPSSVATATRERATASRTRSRRPRPRSCAVSSNASSAATSTTYMSCSSCAVSTRASSGRCSTVRRDIASSTRASFRRDSRSGCRSTRPAGRTSSQTTWPVTPRSLRSCSAPFAERSVTRCDGTEIARCRAAYDPPGCKRREQPRRREAASCVVGARAWRPSLSPPAFERAINVTAYTFSGLTAIGAGHQQPVVAGVLVADRGDHRQLDSLGLQVASGGGASDSPAAARGGAACDRLRTFGGTAGERRLDLSSEAPDELRVFAGASETFTRATAIARLFVVQALQLGGGERILLHQDALALIALAGTAEAHDDRRQRAGRLRAPRQRGVAGCEEDEVVHIRAGQAQRAGLLHDQQLTGPLAGRARPVTDR